jgi:hypothetical protein
MNYKEINPIELPFESIPNRNLLPKASGIYFVINDLEEILYIGKSTNIQSRWQGHNISADLDNPKKCKVSYLEIKDTDLYQIYELEKYFIEKFQPKLNINSSPRVEIFKQINNFNSQLISAKDAAIKLGVSDRRIRAMIKEGKIKAQQIAGGYIIDEKDLEDVQTYGKSGRPFKKKEEK